MPCLVNDGIRRIFQIESAGILFVADMVTRSRLASQGPQMEQKTRELAVDAEEQSQGASQQAAPALGCAMAAGRSNNPSAKPTRRWVVCPISDLHPCTRISDKCILISVAPLITQITQITRHKNAFKKNCQFGSWRLKKLPTA